MNDCDRSLEKLNLARIHYDRISLKENNSLFTRVSILANSLENFSSCKNLEFLLKSESKRRAEQDIELSQKWDKKLINMEKNISNNYTKHFNQIFNSLELLNNKIEKTFSDLSENRLKDDKNSEIVCKNSLRLLQDMADMIEEETTQRECEESKYLQENKRQINFLQDKIKENFGSLKPCIDLFSGGNNTTASNTLRETLTPYINSVNIKEFKRESAIKEISQDLKIIKEKLKLEHISREKNFHKTIENLYKIRNNFFQ